MPALQCGSPHCWQSGGLGSGICGLIGLLVERLRAALAAIPAEAWSLPSTYDATGVHHGYRRVVLVAGGERLEVAEPFGWLLNQYEPIAEAWLSWIDPGGFIVRHIDGGPYRERWQVPIAPGDFNGTNAIAGVPFRVEHWEPHSVTNTDQPRVHIVIDRDIALGVPSAPFTILEEKPDG